MEVFLVVFEKMAGSAMDDFKPGISMMLRHVLANKFFMGFH